MCLNQRSPQLSYWGFDLAIKRWSWILGGHSPHQATHLKSMSQQLCARVSKPYRIRSRRPFPKFPKRNEVDRCTARRLVPIGRMLTDATL